MSSSRGAENTKCLDQLNKFEKLTGRPSLRASGHSAPPARSGHRCVANGSSLYVFGGYNPDYDESGGSENEDYPLFRELWRYHFATGTWQQMRTEGYMPRELASMSAVLHGNNLLVFGGTGIPFGESNGNEVHVCNVKYKRWSLLNCRGKKPNRIYGQHTNHGKFHLGPRTSLPGPNLCYVEVEFSLNGLLMEKSKD
ncbi:KLD10 protein, partial [Polypterus senegalus]